MAKKSGKCYIILMNKDQNLTNKRHTLAHLLGASLLELYPDIKLTIGPAIENGFYYDFESSQKITEDDLPKIEQKMKELLPEWNSFTKKIVEVGEAKEYFK